VTAVIGRDLMEAMDKVTAGGILGEDHSWVNSPLSTNREKVCKYLLCRLYALCLLYEGNVMTLIK
jgi:hypothetical protein